MSLKSEYQTGGTIHDDFRRIYIYIYIRCFVLHNYEYNGFYLLNHGISPGVTDSEKISIQRPSPAFENALDIPITVKLKTIPGPSKGVLDCTNYALQQASLGTKMAPLLIARTRQT